MLTYHKRQMATESKELNVAKLCEAMRRSRLSDARGRQEVVSMVRQSVGNHYSEEGTSEEVPVNLIALYLQIMRRSLVAQNPRVMLSTFQQQNKPAVAAMQDWVGPELEKIKFADTMKRSVTDALFSFGIVKVALATPSDSAHLAFSLRAGQPFAETVHRDDFCYDAHARDFSQCSFIGHRYRVPLDTVRDSNLYNKEARQALVASHDPIYNEQGDERISVIGRGTYAAYTEEYEDMVDLWEVWMPRRRIIVTLAADQILSPEISSAYGDYSAYKSSNIKALRVQRWIGPDSGPYHFLGFLPTPGNLLPQGPIQHLYGLHMLANNIYRKLTDQSENMKNLMFWSGNENDAVRIQNANDGECPRVDNPERIVVRDFRGPNQQLIAMFIDTVQRFSYMAGGMDLSGGLSPQSKTATQDKLLAQNAAATVSAMQDATITHATDVIRAMLWFYKHDPFQVQKSVFALPGMPEISTVRQVTPQERQRVPWDEMRIKIDPYSLTHDTPESIWQQITGMLKDIVLPLMPLLQQQGIMLDMNKLLEKGGRYLNVPDIAEILTVAAPPAQEPAGQGGKPPTPELAGSTERNYNRTSTPGRTDRGDQMNFLNALRGINPGGNQQTANGQNHNGTPQ